MATSVASPARNLPRVRAGGRFAVPALLVVAALPVSLALWTAARAPKIHVLLDYWHVLAKITADDGSVQWANVFTYHLDQPFVVPSLLFWADAAWFGGDNRALTVLAVALLAVLVLLLRAMLPGSWSPVRRAAVTAGFAFLAFSSHLAELWLQATNGISWVPAVVCAVAAVVCAHRGRVWLSWGVAALGCLCFGAALPVWFAVALTSALRGDRRWRVVTPIAAGALVIAGWLATKPSGPQSLATTAIDPDHRLAVFAAAVGGLWSGDVPALAVIAGALTLAALVLLAAHLGRARTGVAGWLGLAAYAVMVACLIALGRTTAADGNVGLLSRYGLVAALAGSALLVLAVAANPLPRLRFVVVGVITAGLLTQALGGVTQDRVRAAYAPLGLAAVALRVEAPRTLATLSIEPSVVPAARALGAFPFTDRFTLGCAPHELGGHVDLSALPALPGPADSGGTKGVVDSDALIGDTPLSGWATVDGQAPDCVLLADATGTIVGGGLTMLPRPDTVEPGWQAVAATGTVDLTVVAGKAGRLYRVLQNRH